MILLSVDWTRPMVWTLVVVWSVCFTVIAVKLLEIIGKNWWRRE